jgi:hypothetical protein
MICGNEFEKYYTPGDLTLTAKFLLLDSEYVLRLQIHIAVNASRLIVFIVRFSAPNDFQSHITTLA